MTLAARVDIEHIMESLLMAAVIQTPFEHCIIKSLFSEADFNKIHRYWPQLDAFEPLSTINPDWYPERRQFKLTNENLLSLTSNQTKFWGNLRQSLISTAFSRAVAAKFGPTLAPRMKAMSSGVIELDLRIMEDRSNYSLAPHTDIKSKLLTILIYLPHDITLAEFGTSLYKPRDPNRIFTSDQHHAREDFELVSTVPFLPNSAFVFPRTDRSFHGVEPFIKPNATRKMLVYNIYLKAEN